jgi:excisionase family DNA binding protein
MAKTERIPDIMTPEQVADYLQLDRETVYRYIRQGKLAASKLGRKYRVPKRSVDLLLWSTRTRQDIPLREYTDAQVEEFLREDQLTEDAAQIAQRFRAANPG